MPRTRYSKPSRELVLECLSKAGKSLTVSEIASMTGVAYNTVRGRLYELKKKGLVRKTSDGWMASG